MARNIKKGAMARARGYLSDGSLFGGRPASAEVKAAAAALGRDDVGTALGHTYAAFDRLRDALCELNLALGAHQERLCRPRRSRAKKR